jgi:HlyD family secretion protein
VRRAWFFGLIVLAIAGAIGFFFWGPTSGGAVDAPYRLASVDRGPITASVRATGTLNPITTVVVGSQLSGQVVEILADYNSPVKAGQVVARLYAEQIRARRDAAAADVAQSRADLAQRRAQVERTRATKQRAQAALQDTTAQRDRTTAQFADARRNLERQQELFNRGISTPIALDTARTQAEVQKAALASNEALIASAKAELIGLDADIALGEAQVKSAEAAILQREAKLRDAEIDLDRTQIRSPVDGVVVQRQIDLGQTVAASLNAPTLFTIAQDLREIDIQANIDEADVGRMKEGQTVSFTVNAYTNRTYEGRVRMVRLGAQTLQNVVTYTTIVRVQNADLSLLPGMTANVQILTDERPSALRVPNAALRFKPAGVAAPPLPAAPPAGAAVAASASGPPRGGRALQELRERVAAEVQPTPEQTTAIERIFADARANFPSRDAGLSDEERRAAFRQIRRDMEDKIAATLDPERRMKFVAITTESRPSDGGAPARAFVLDGEGRRKPVSLRLGVTDGSVTEVLSGELKEGDAVVVSGGPKAQGPVQENLPVRPRGPRMF